MNMTISALARHAPEPRLPRLALVDDLGPLLPREDEAAFTTLPERIAPGDIPAELRELSRQTELWLCHPSVQAGSVPETIARHLRVLADRVAE